MPDINIGFQRLLRTVGRHGLRTVRVFSTDGRCRRAQPTLSPHYQAVKRYSKKKLGDSLIKLTFDSGCEKYSYSRVTANARKTTTVIKLTIKIKSQPHIQADLLAPTHWRPLGEQKSLNFANTIILLNLN